MMQVYVVCAYYVCRFVMEIGAYPVAIFRRFSIENGHRYLRYIYCDLCILGHCYSKCVLPPAVSCGPAPIAPANGQKRGFGTTFGSTVTYRCDPGYTLQGSDTITCMANKQWSERAPTCNGKLLCNAPL